MANDDSLTPAQRASYGTFLDRVGRYFFWLVLVVMAVWLAIITIGV
ncbi:MAG: hypothetical protein H6765_03445 [Candidatus Peribacteria bacterium]|nr:MAG: hypothetical protein H6765_03445 [Candidatus Peribacteria bacterium]